MWIHNYSKILKCRKGGSRNDPEVSEGSLGLENAQKSKFLELDENNTIVSGSFSRFRPYIYFLKHNLYEKFMTL
jgi:hypothetical protein